MEGKDSIILDAVFRFYTLISYVIRALSLDFIYIHKDEVATRNIMNLTQFQALN